MREPDEGSGAAEGQERSAEAGPCRKQGRPPAVGESGLAAGDGQFSAPSGRFTGLLPMGAVGQLRPSAKGSRDLWLGRPRGLPVRSSCPPWGVWAAACNRASRGAPLADSVVSTAAGKAHQDRSADIQMSRYPDGMGCPPVPTVTQTDVRLDNRRDITSLGWRSVRSVSGANGRSGSTPHTPRAPSAPCARGDVNPGRALLAGRLVGAGESASPGARTCLPPRRSPRSHFRRRSRAGADTAVRPHASRRPLERDRSRPPLARKCGAAGAVHPGGRRPGADAVLGI